ncbi:glucose-1-phosphate adenylyltransferase small subunit 1, chloroplastic isoform X7 [Physcomitrium patens]|uniref:glucose-1-phosphate adenylyltransferase small subunit 1, chloroplastic isoform X7 n=1 Tax=Physcomitrium patens TaxID=3218 RepID=UPI003CCDD9E4
MMAVAYTAAVMPTAIINSETASLNVTSKLSVRSRICSFAKCSYSSLGSCESFLGGTRMADSSWNLFSSGKQSSRKMLLSPRAISDYPVGGDASLYSVDASRSVLGIILGGGAGTRLYPLTKKRAKPAVPIGANYRLIDIPGTADAVRQYLWLFEEAQVMDYVILGGDHLYRMDYQKFIQVHRDTGADITVAALPMDEARASAFGLMKIDGKGRIYEFAEKPKEDELRAMQVDTTVLGLDSERAKLKSYIASMGIYVVRKEAMVSLLRKDFPEANDFGSEVIPGATKSGMKVQAYLFDGYWEDIGTIEAFYNANLGITKKPVPDFSFYDRISPIYTQPRFLPPSKMMDADIRDSVIGEGCIIRNAAIYHSSLGLRSWVSEGAVVEDTLLMGADYYEQTDQQRRELLSSGGIPMGIGRNSIVKRAIVDKNARIGENVQIVNVDNVREAEREADGFFIRSGLVTIFKDAIIPDGTII